MPYTHRLRRGVSGTGVSWKNFLNLIIAVFAVIIVIIVIAVIIPAVVAAVVVRTAFLVRTVIGIPIAAGLLYALGGPLLSPMFAGAAMSLSSVCVVGNALRLGTVKL